MKRKRRLRVYCDEPEIRIRVTVALKKDEAALVEELAARGYFQNRKGAHSVSAVVAGLIRIGLYCMLHHHESIDAAVYSSGLAPEEAAQDGRTIGTMSIRKRRRSKSQDLMGDVDESIPIGMVRAKPDNPINYRAVNKRKPGAE